MKEKLYKLLTEEIDISQFDTCIGWQMEDYYEDYYLYFDSKDDVERRGSILIFAWMLHGAWNGAEYPFSKIEKEDLRRPEISAKHHDIVLYLDKFIKCKNEIEKDFPISFYSVGFIIQELLADNYFSPSRKTKLMEIDGFSEIFCTDHLERKYFHEHIREEMDVDMMIKILERERNDSN